MQHLPRDAHCCQDTLYNTTHARVWYRERFAPCNTGVSASAVAKARAPLPLHSMQART